MPTFHFFLYLALLAGAYVFKLAYIGWFGPYLMGALCLLPPLLLLLSLPSMLSLRAEISAPDRVSQGSDSELCVLFKTRALLPLSRVNIRVQLENRYDGEVNKTKYCYAGVLSSTGRVPLPTALCGTLVISVIRLECRDLLGLFVIRRRCTAKAVCTVLPDPAAPDQCPDIDACLDSAVQLRPKYGGGYAEEHELREYRPGDTVNAIHWKLSAKTGKLMLRQPMEPQRGLVLVTMTLRGAPEELDRKFGRLLWLGRYLAERNVSFELRVLTGQGVQSFPVDGEWALNKAIDSLLCTEAAEKGSIRDHPFAASWHCHIGGEPDES